MTQTENSILAVSLEYSKWRSGYMKRLDLDTEKYLQWIMNPDSNLGLESWNLTPIFLRHEQLNYAVTNIILSSSTYMYVDSINDIVYIVLRSSMFDIAIKEQMKEGNDAELLRFDSLLKEVESDKKYVILIIHRNSLWFDYKKHAKIRAEFEAEHQKEIENSLKNKNR